MEREKRDYIEVIKECFFWICVVVLMGKWRDGKGEVSVLKGMEKVGVVLWLDGIGMNNLKV